MPPFTQGLVAYPPLHPTPGHRVLHDDPEKFRLQVTLKLSETFPFWCIPLYAVTAVKLFPTVIGTF